jgi:uncharacterized tellurite resistance protein B-like protein
VTWADTDVLNGIWSWLGLDRREEEESPLRELVNALDQLEPERARYLARFAYLLGRVAHADQQVSAKETAAMERLVLEEGGITPDQAMLVVSLAKTSNLLFGGTADFEVARDFAAQANYEDKLALARCLFAVAASEDAVSMSEETEIHRILNQLKIQPADLTALRVAHRSQLPGISPRPTN